ncbi:L-seryl-tRNA(Sec) selenium transferase [Budvicia aquatica]|uniref:L-seryl-tRNA(Sec) selenium transferase n=1 Tax=Budvicia aquatica TaxID=82979 RepID=A0A2C6DIP2_9GAMM|nr:L-seryl-tRNA(Sec) selenium transferase [Budvicia aquatica]PHI28192.1 L-seryl-tRNA(Sec) selenium transferase [Budvicia aquatica]VFS46039.1 L-seryl-tRNA(Sec) selenium transferase [Budvicia aquatica]
MNNQAQSLYSQIPSVDRLLNEPAMSALVVEYGQHLVVESLRYLQQQARQQITHSASLPEWCHDWASEVSRYLMIKQRAGLQPVFNLSGTVLHTNLGRALLAEEAIDAVASAMRNAVTLEYDLDGAGRGHRDNVISELLCELTGAQAACIVNNNAAAVLLMLAAVAPDKEVVVSRGELVEIGGAFRVPDVMRQAGCKLVEVGTTNRTHLRDYRDAANDNTGLLMKVHTSNYSIEGFTAAVDEKELVALGRELNLPVATDLGSGSLIDLQQYGLPAEPMPQNLIAAGVDLVTFSGDKLLGGPQAGIIVGAKHWIEKIQRHPLKRALRAGKITLAALEATLRLYQQPERLQSALPTLRLLSRDTSEMKRMAADMLSPLQQRYGEEFNVSAEPCLSQIGSGSLPVDRLPSYALTFSPKDGRGRTLEALAERWRGLPVPVIGRLQEGKLWLDLRCLQDERSLLEMLLA